ncbi:MAG TPA: hypothetical protein VKX28_11230 [Xanthobacteraceae bacterium]|nr:hypothetical protein [Xanthobacteraceae bacterium]
MAKSRIRPGDPSEAARLLHFAITGYTEGERRAFWCAHVHLAGWEYLIKVVFMREVGGMIMTPRYCPILTARTREEAYEVAATSAARLFAESAPLAR